MTTPRLAVSRLALLGALLGSVTCKPGVDAPAETVDISPANPSIPEEGELVVTVGGASGSSYAWVTKDPSIAIPTLLTTGPSSTVRGLAPGTTTLTVIVKDGSTIVATGATSITVTERTVTSVTVTPEASSVIAGATVELSAVAKAGTVAVNRSFLWSSNNANFAVDERGVVTVSPDAPAGATGTITAQVGLLGESGTATITVEPSTLAISAAPFSVSIPPGGSGFAAVIIDRDKYRGVVSLSMSGLPPGVTGTFSILNPVPGSSSGPNIHLVADANAVPGTYTVTVSAIGVNVAPASATFTLIVTGFSFSLTPAAITVVAGASGNTSVQLFRGTASPVTFSYSSADGITGTFGTNPVSNPLTTTLFTVVVPAGLVPGTYDVIVTGTGPPPDNFPHNQTLKVTVSPGARILVSAVTTYSNQLQETTTQANRALIRIAINVTRQNFNSDVLLTPGPLDAGITSSFTAPQNLPPPGDIVIADLTVENAAIGDHILTFTATATVSGQQVTGQATFTIHIPGGDRYAVTIVKDPAVGGNDRDGVETDTKMLEVQEVAILKEMIGSTPKISVWGLMIGHVPVSLVRSGSDAFDGAGNFMASAFAQVPVPNQPQSTQAAAITITGTIGANSISFKIRILPTASATFQFGHVDYAGSGPKKP